LWVEVVSVEVITGIQLSSPDLKPERFGSKQNTVPH
jgi:hypothetical protein